MLSGFLNLIGTLSRTIGGKLGITPKRGKKRQTAATIAHRRRSNQYPRQQWEIQQRALSHAGGDTSSARY